MTEDNLYQVPKSNLNSGEGYDEFCKLNFFSAKGRIGRVRLLGWSMGSSMVMLLVVLIITAFIGATTQFEAKNPLGMLGLLGGILIFVIYIAFFYVHFVFIIQRCHDINMSGWFSIIFVIVPLIMLALYFIPGSTGTNRYAAPPPPNSAGVILLACILPGIAILGIVAAILIPQLAAH